MGAFKLLNEEIKNKISESFKSDDFQKIFKSAKEEGDDRFEIVISTSDRDRQGEIIEVNGWDLEFYKLNPVVLWAHNYDQLPIGLTDEIKIEDDKLVARGRFASEEANPFAGYVKRLYQDKILRAASVGFIPKEQEGNRITKAELLEISFVPVPANPFALSLQKEVIADYIKKGIFFEEKGAVPSHETPTADEETPWDAAEATGRLARWASSDGSGEKDKIDWTKYKEGFAWYDAENKENFGAYKLPHHDIIDGRFKVVWRGVAAAAVAVQGGRNPVDIPDADIEGVKRHLTRHYRQFDKIPPWGEKECLECGKIFKIDRPSHHSVRKFCSRECYAKWLSKNVRGEKHPNWKERIRKVCKNCGEEFFIEKWRLEGAEREKKNRGIFCSNECRQEYQKGENHPSYKGTYDYNEREEFRKTEEWEKIRNAVLERDGWKCWLCGDTGILNVHHIKNWKDYPDLRLDPSNLVTLCIECHKLMHKGKDFWKAMGLKENTEPTLKMPDIDWDLVEEKDEENNKISLESEPEVIENYNSFKTISEGEEKSGRVLSEKNRNLIKNSILQMKAAIAALEELLSATEPQGGEDEEKSKQRSKDVESDKQAFQDWLAMRQILRSAVNSISSSLETLNYKIRERSK